MDEETFLNPEKAALDWLRIFAEKTGGTFPKSLDDLTEFDKVFPKKTKAGALPDAETLRAVQSAFRFIMATRSLKEKLGHRSNGGAAVTQTRSCSGIAPAAKSPRSRSISTARLRRPAVTGRGTSARRTQALMAQLCSDYK